MCAENQIRSSVKTARLQPKRSTPKKAKLPIRERKILQGAKQPSDVDKSQTIVNLSSQIMISTVCGLCLLEVVTVSWTPNSLSSRSFL